MSGSLEPDDLVLALETSGEPGTVAVGTAVGQILAERSLEERRQHAARLVPTVALALEAAGVGREELAGVVVGEGPGSFTGVRVAAATAKGLCLALGIPLRAVSSLVAAALAERDSGAEEDRPPAIRYVLFDARGDRVYGACYGMGSAGVETLVPPHAGTVRDVLAGDVPPGAVFVGEGALRHQGPIHGAGFGVGPPPLGGPAARGLLRYLALHPDTPAVDARATWEPAYLRASNAEREWRG